MPQLVEADGQARQLLNAEFTRLSDRVEQLQAERAQWLFQHGRASGTRRSDRRTGTT